MNCFHCGRQVELTRRIGFREVCPVCDRSLHVCLNCGFYDPTFNNQCREPQAERVVDKDRANFCEYFSMRKTNELQRQSPANDARAKLEALFKKKL
ncbi:MAG: hypothetical protein JO189_14915 [Deltaproteobacteria bacterium]|nr:hypothetical protein [Deltaproteobacteria bacterium]